MFGDLGNSPALFGLLIAFVITVAAFCMWASGWPGGDDR